MRFITSISRRLRSYKLSLGFTLLEALMVLALLAILITISAPSLRHFIDQQRIHSSSMQLERALMTARQYAVLHGESIELCPVAGCGAAWRGGWQLLKQHTVLRQWSGVDAPMQLTWKGSFGKTTPVFNAAGDAAISGSFTLCMATTCQRVVVSRSGRVRVE